MEQSTNCCQPQLSIISKIIVIKEEQHLSYLFSGVYIDIYIDIEMCVSDSADTNESNQVIV